MWDCHDCSIWWGKKLKKNPTILFFPKWRRSRKADFFFFLFKGNLGYTSAALELALLIHTALLWCRLQCRTRQDLSISALSPLYAQHSVYLINQMQWCHWWFNQAWFTIQKIVSKIPIQFGNDIKSFNANLHIQCKASAWMMWITHGWFLLFHQ